MTAYSWNSLNAKLTRDTQWNGRVRFSISSRVRHLYRTCKMLMLASACGAGDRVPGSREITENLEHNNSKLFATITTYLNLPEFTEESQLCRIQRKQVSLSKLPAARFLTLNWKHKIQFNFWGIYVRLSIIVYYYNVTSDECVCFLDSDETIDRFLLHCPLYDNIRTRLLPAQPTILIVSTMQLQRRARYNTLTKNGRKTIVCRLMYQEW